MAELPGIERETLDVDVVIVGAGPAGLAAAYKLAELIRVSQRVRRGEEARRHLHRRPGEGEGDRLARDLRRGDGSARHRRADAGLAGARLPGRVAGRPTTRSGT